MANATAGAREATRGKAVATKRPDPWVAKCHEWDEYRFIGDSATYAAQRHPGQWQLVYDLRPLELIPYWLGIPFKPHRPLYAVIYDETSRTYWTMRASKVKELGRPRLVRGAFPLVRLLALSDVADRGLWYLAELASSGVTTLSDALVKCVERIESRLFTSRRAA